MKKTILVLNMGMKSIRSIIFDSDGNKLASAAVPIETSLSGKTVTQNPDEWLEKADTVIFDSIHQIDNLHVDYITVTTSASCLVCIDKDGKPLLPCMMVSDKRAEEESEFIKNAQEFKSVYEDTQLSMDCSLLLPKALWVKNHHPEIWAKVYKLLVPNDFLIAYLTGNLYVTDYINAQKWHYSIKDKCYPVKLLDKLGINASLLPNVVAPGDKVAFVEKDLAEKLNINKDALVIASTYDAICSFIVNENGLYPSFLTDIIVSPVISAFRLNIPF